jgi:O-antigen ligase
MSSRALTYEGDANPLWHLAGLLLRPLHLGMAFPSVLYVAVMTVFLFRPPDISLFYIDRISFCILLFFVILRSLALRDKVPFLAGISLPMLGLMALALFRVLREPFDAQIWSIVASKYIVPFTLFHVAVLAFRTPSQRWHFAVFAIFVLAYLVFIAVAFLTNAHALVFPRFILDESIGFHADRARGPFLQAVANGVSLNILGILVIALRGIRKAVIWTLWLFLPLAILATMTRAIWISFTVSTLILGFRLVERRLLVLCTALAMVALVAGLSIGASNHSLRAALLERTAERGPLAARLAVYEAGWTMFRERPFTGWPAGIMYSELARRMEGYHLRAFYVHNTYLALLVEFGVPGLALYAILFFNLLRLTWRHPRSESSQMASLRRVWPILLGVYLFNAFFVDMAYQFVIGLMFTIAGILCASEEAVA